MLKYAKHDEQAIKEVIVRLLVDIEFERAKLISLQDVELSNPHLIEQSQKLDSLISQYTKLKLCACQTR
jgi:hypothetical protein